MSRDVYRDADSYTIEWDDDLGALIHSWDSYTSGQPFRDAANDLLEHVRSENVSKLIIDSSGIKAHDTEDKQWLMEEWTPKLDAAGIEYTATVHADSSISKMELDKMTEDTSEFDSEQMATSDLAEARAWLADK